MTNETQQSLGARTVAGLRAFALPTLVGPPLQIIQFVALTYFLSPEEVGYWVIPAWILGLGSAIFESGITIAYVRESEEHRVRTPWAWGVLLVPVWIGLVAHALWEADAATATLMIVGSALIIVLMIANVPARALLTRAGQFRALGRNELRSVFIVVFGTVALLLAGFGAYAILVASIVRQAYVWLSNRRDAKELLASNADRPVMRPRIWPVMYQILNSWAANLDYILVGIVLTTADAGTYYLATSLSVVLARRLYSTVTRVFLPLYASTEGTQQRSFGQLVLALGAVQGYVLALGAFVFISLLATFVPDRWDESFDVARILCLGIAVLGAQTVAAQLLTALKRDASLIATAAGTAAAMGLAFVVLSPRSPGEAAPLTVGVITASALITAILQPADYRLRAVLTWMTVALAPGAALVLVTVGQETVPAVGIVLAVGTVLCAVMNAPLARHALRTRRQPQTS